MKVFVRRVWTSAWKRKWLLLAGLGLGVVGLVYANSQNPFFQDDEIVTQEPVIQTISQTLNVTGDVDADERADLTFNTGGRLSWVGVKEGEWVQQWQAIASLDTRTLQKQLQQAVNAYVQIARDHTVEWDDYEKHKDPNIIAELRPLLEYKKFDLDRPVLYQLDDAALNIEIQQLAIRLSSLVSPISGMVTRLDEPYAGVNVGPTDVFQIVNPNTVFFAAVVDEVDISKLNTGQSAVIRLDAYPDEEIVAAVQKIDFTPSTSRSGGTGYRVHFSLPVSNNSLKYKVGMSGTAEVLLSEKIDVLTIPTDSLITRDGVEYVEVLGENGTEEREVEIGVETDELVEIVSGLSEEDLVVVPQQES